MLSEYESAARRLDQKHHATSQHNVGPVLSALRAFPPVRGMVFGAYGEASKDIHTILHVAAEARARRDWKTMGSRNLAEALSVVVSTLRRRWGLAAVREYARLRLNRLCYVGGSGRCPRSMQMAGPAADQDVDGVVFSASAFGAPH